MSTHADAADLELGIPRIAPDPTGRRPAEAITTSHVLDLRSITRVAAIVGAVAAVIAVVIASTVAAQARRWLGFTFTGVPPRIGEAGSILLDNARFVFGLGAAAWIAQLRVRRAPGVDRTGGEQLLGLAAPAVDLVVALAALINVALVGLAVGAYGSRMLAALLPHGPFEVCAFCIAGNLFLTARRRSISGREWTTAILASISLLSLAAVLETFAWLG